MRCPICNRSFQAAGVANENSSDPAMGRCPQCVAQDPLFGAGTSGPPTEYSKFSPATIAALKSLLNELAVKRCESSRTKLVVKELKSMVMININRLDAIEAKLKSNIEDVFTEERNAQIMALHRAVAGLRERTEPLVTVNTELEIFQFPEDDDEDLVRIVLAIARFIHCGTKERDLDFVARIGEPQAGIRAILVGFTQESSRNAYWYAAAYKHSIYVDDLPEFKGRLMNKRILVSERHVNRECSDEGSDYSG